MEGNEMDIWKESVRKEIDDIKRDQHIMKDDIKDLKHKDSDQDKEISYLKQMLYEIKEDTKWLRRTITKAIITAIATAVIGGVIALFFSQL
ncbi:hemolysin XhlA family protein [Gracilibacillus thailandensis]|uniref:Protein xhlA n=1 Tax=Gracilibacillus thailandensis TaxID=563735 RepID=A0A6N7QWR5_9BACI|nr:hemolysin XhlA family protein [Gracilibacillus thailandensis]MRI65170.1 hypothetical protein [Gracilibacillus thailandensis]